MLSIFDIYFKKPVVHGKDPIPPAHLPSLQPSSSRTGCGQISSSSPTPMGISRWAPFLLSVILIEPRVAEVSMPGRQLSPGPATSPSLLLAFMRIREPSWKGLEANPLEFDSVFKRSFDMHFHMAAQGNQMQMHTCVLLSAYMKLSFGGLAPVLMGWILVECAILSSTKNQVENLDEKLVHSHDERSLKLSHLRVLLTFQALKLHVSSQYSVLFSWQRC